MVRRMGFTETLAVATLIGFAAVALCADATPHQAKAAAGVLADFADGEERIAVIVHLFAPPQATAELSPHSDTGERSRLEVNRPLVSESVARLRASLDSSHLSRVRPFVLQPAFSAVVSPRGLLHLMNDPSVRFVEQDRKFQTHTMEGLELIGGDQLHLLGYTGAGTAVAIIDTGIDYLHPTLGGSSIPNAKIVRGLDTADNDDDPMDCGAHGTAVASVAAGTSYQWNPQKRFAGGVAPQAKILAYKASPDNDCGSITQSAVIQAMEDALLHRTGDGYQLVAINLSFGSGAFEGPCDGSASSYSSVVSAATQAGVCVVASTGNDGWATSIAMPACVADVISVGSVWDTDTASVPFSFCLDPECTRTCNDSFLPAGAITCYSNAGSTLDVLAPSEFLKAARANGKTIDFGGTSGAAAYVTGSLALLHQADPSITPGAAGRLLHLTGRPTLDLRSGIVRPRIHLPQVLEEGARIHFPAESAIPIPRTPGMTAVSDVVVTDTQTVGSIRVLLHVDHPDPETLFIILRAPDGTEARLHDHTPGSIASSGSATTNQGVWGLYPDEIHPADSLGVFAGGQAAGTWSLEVREESADESGTANGTLVGWALAIQPVLPPASNDHQSVSLPVVADGPGAFETHWASDLRIFNPSEDTSATARLYLLPASGSTQWPYRQTEIIIPQNSVLDLPSVLARRFAASDLRASLRLESAHQGLVMTSRTFTGDVDSGTYGQYIGASNPDQTLGVGTESVALLQLAVNDDYRTNLGFTELDGAPVLLRMTLRDGLTGAAVAQPMLVELGPFGNIQKNLGGFTGDDLFAVVEAIEGTGRASVYASVVDNHTGDAIFVPAVHAETANATLVVPVVARQEGRNETSWRTDLRVANLGPSQTTLELGFRPRQGDSGSPITIQSTVAPGMVFAADDIIATHFGLTEAVGSLTISVVAGATSIAATSRTYNRVPMGSFGQFVGAVTSGVGPSARLTHLGSSPQMRTNIGLCEVSGHTARVRAVLRDMFGRQIGAAVVFTADPYQLIQVDDIFAATGAEPTPTATVELESISEGGDWVAYASVVDATTGDAIFVPAVPVED